MKKIVLSLVLMFCVSLAFAGTGKSKKVNVNPLKTKKSFRIECFILSCGITKCVNLGKDITPEQSIGIWNYYNDLYC